ncbi:MAG: 5'-deoxyadenosine deaminase [Gemmatimonadota bacterium]|nr:5'-deoxyadenosine deaminase [Gemmatimonadota bacterium]MDP6803588.1 5'-deoxyadenosine deaminase [Gemmatimonadota bacterium]MDP7031851.1 5'-deoxyadenosine deaminase [Gemmatimonadota bacterium]
MTATLLRGAARILCGGPDWEESTGDLLVVDGRIRRVGGDLAEEAPADARRVDASGLTLMPGLVQTHVHLCQTLFRGLAEDRTLLPWLRERIWPLEAAHDPASLRASARLSVLELLLGGTTTVLDMGTTHHYEEVFTVLEETGIRAFGGKAMMDDGEGVPAGLLETTLDSLRESFDLAEKWDGAAGGRLRYAFAPRFVLSCTDELLREVVSLAGGKYLLHTHASEGERECRAVEEMKGRRNVCFFDDIGFLGKGTVLAHCVWLDEEEVTVLARSGSRAVHCPGTNLKLGSGVQPAHRLREAGVHLSLGCDGAPANNRLDGFSEMRAAALLSSWTAGPGRLSARDVLTMATLGGAEALGMDDRVGRLAPGMEADVIAVDLNTAHASPVTDPVTALVYSAQASDVRLVLVAGELLVEDGAPCRLDRAAVLTDANRCAATLLERAAPELPGWCASSSFASRKGV